MMMMMCHFDDPFWVQRENFGLYALYSKNKPQSDALIQQHKFFKVRNVNNKETYYLSAYCLFNSLMVNDF